MNTLQSDKLALAALGILVSVGSKHIKDDMNEVLETLFRNVLMRRFLVFAVAYIYSRDITASIVMTILFIMMVVKSAEFVNNNSIS